VNKENLNKIVLLIDPDDVFVRLLSLIDVLCLDWIFAYLFWLMNIMGEYLYAYFI
jgi:hypothetical protein